MKKIMLLGAIFSLPAFSQEILLKEVELKAKRETFKESLEIREVRESFAKDVGEALTKIEGLSKFRKGGIANDVIIRAFQRDNINVLIDDAEVHAACPNRMDPPAFHVDFSEVERIEVIKGPFDITHQGSLGGLVNIITKKPEQGFRAKINLTLGSFDYRNISPVISYRDERFYGLAGYSYKYSKPYKDGDGKRITEYPTGMNAYRPQFRNSKAFEINTYWAKFGFSPLANHELEFAYTKQDARHVLYPALMMDADYDKTDRFNLTYKVDKISDLLNSLSFQLFYTKVDHWMDNRYRSFTGNPTKGYTMATDAQTKTLGTRLEAQIRDFSLGFEAYRRNWDAINYGWNQNQNTYMRQFIIPDVDITNFGVYGEYKKSLRPNLRLVAGLRLDTTESKADSSKANTNLYFAFHNTRSTSKRDTYPSGNVQLFYNLTPELEIFTGLGYAVRVPDQQERYFALNRSMMCNPPSNPFCVWVGNPNLKPSKNLELDLGVKHQTPKSLTKATLFVSYVQDYITIHRKNPVNTFTPPGGQAMTYANVDARFFGLEFSSNYNVWNNLFLFGGFSYTEGRKDTKPSLNITDKDVAEVPPLKGRLGLRYDTGMWYAETEIVASATQNKVDSDLRETKTSGYGIVNLKAGVNYRGFTINAGVENVFDKKYFEHFSYVRNPFSAGVKIPEPGRSFYLSASYQF